MRKIRTAGVVVPGGMVWGADVQGTQEEGKGKKALNSIVPLLYLCPLALWATLLNRCRSYRLHFHLLTGR